MTCDYCGYTKAPVSKVKIKGRDYKGKRRQKTLRICSCCDAWGATSNIEKIIMISDIDFDEGTIVIL